VGSDVVGTVPGAAVLVDPAVEEGALGEPLPAGTADDTGRSTLPREDRRRSRIPEA
jgi:hypothetical protein